MEAFEQKALDVFSEIVINKSFVNQAGFGSRAIPIYVREWIISHYLDDSPQLSQMAREKIARFMQRYMPDKSQKEAIKNQLYEQMEVQLLDNYSVYVNLAKGDRYLHIPYLDEDSAFTTPQIVQENEMLLSSGLWGVGSLYYVPKSEENERGQIWMREFRPFQLANLDLDYYRECRKSFSIQEWIDFLVSSMGFNWKLYSERQKILLISRLIPMVETRFNLVELAPKGTGKSFVFENMSRYVAVRSGAISPAVLFFNDARKTSGLITRYDCVVIDEAQKVKADTSGELTALLKSYLESGRFGRGSADAVPAEAGLVMLANIELDHNKRPVNEQIGLFRVFPNFLRETAFIDRFSGLLPGWELPRIQKETPSTSIGLKGDIFGEILHSLRSDISYRDYVMTNTQLKNSKDMRDSRAIEAGATGLLKILFPDKQPSEADFYRYCVNPALELRQRVRDELCKLDREYQPVSMKSIYPDDFQNQHQHASYVEAADLKNDEPPSYPESYAEAQPAVLPAQDINQLIIQGESNQVEFKASLRWSVIAERLDSKLGIPPLKTIVAFLNTEGGTLLIGVQDDKSILGIGADQFENEDKYLLHFASLVNDKIGKQFAPHILWNLVEVDNKKILQVNCLKSSKPAFLKMDGKEEFYIRTGPSTVQLTPSEMLDYINAHFR